MSAEEMSRMPTTVQSPASPTPALTKRTAFTNRCRIAMRRSSPALNTMARNPCASGGASSSSGIGFTSTPSGSPPPHRRRRPAMAMIAASNFPFLTCSSRESTAPRIGCSFAFGKVFLAYAARRSLEMPIREGRNLLRPSALTTQQSRGSSRFGNQNQSRSSAMGDGRSFAEWMAKSISPRRTAASRSRVKKSGALRSMGVARSRSPGVENAVRR